MIVVITPLSLQYLGVPGMIPMAPLLVNIRFLYVASLSNEPETDLILGLIFVI